MTDASLSVANLTRANLEMVRKPVSIAWTQQMDKHIDNYEKLVKETQALERQDNGNTRTTRNLGRA